MLSIHCRLIILLTIFVWLTLTLAKVCPHSHTITAVAGGKTGREATEEPNTRSNIEVAKPPVFNREAGKVGGFIMTCRLYLRMQIREASVEEHI